MSDAVVEAVRVRSEAWSSRVEAVVARRSAQGKLRLTRYVLLPSTR